MISKKAELIALVLLEKLISPFPKKGSTYRISSWKCLEAEGILFLADQNFIGQGQRPLQNKIKISLTKLFLLKLN